MAAAAKKTMGVCPVCSVPIELEANGKVGWHQVGEQAWSMKVCDGVGMASAASGQSESEKKLKFK